MNKEPFSPNSNSDPNPLAEQWSNLGSSNTSDNPRSNLSSTENFDHLQDLRHQLAEEQLELKNLEGELAVQKAIDAIEARQIAEDEAEWKRFEAEEEARMAEAARQDEEYERLNAEIERQRADDEAFIAKMRHEEEKEELSYAQYLFSDIDLSFYDIESSPRYILNNLVELVGVYADIKPLAFEHITTGFDESDKRTEEIIPALEEVKDSLQKLGISFTHIDERPADEDPGVITWYASKDPKLIQEYLDLQKQYYEATPAEQDNITRRQGQLLGYPATATEYFIQHDRERGENPDTPPVDGGIGPKFSRYEYIHSPEHAEEEYQAYEEPLYVAVRRLLPNYTERLDAELSTGKDSEDNHIV